MLYHSSALQDQCYPGTTVLINKLGFRRQKDLDEAEKILVSTRSIEILESDDSEQFSFAFYCGLHRKLFEDLYSWAGMVRTVDLSKKATVFYPASEIVRIGEAIFARIRSENEYRDMTKGQFVPAVSELYHDLNMLHPFREGNGRTERIFFSLLIRRAGYQIDFSECDMDRLMAATVYAAQGVMDFLNSFFSEAIQD